MFGIDPAVLALLGALFGGAGLKFVEKLMSRGQEKEDMAEQIRKELREDLSAVRAELKEEQKSRDELQERYWLLMEENAALKAQVSLASYKTRRVVEEVNNTHPEIHLDDVLELPE